ncbi:MAG: response regulator, partial [Candidatus Nitrotoga sp.]
QRFRIFTRATSDVVYRLNADWSEMQRLEDSSVTEGTPEPSSNWIETYIHPDDKFKVLNHVADAIKEKRVFELEHRFLRADGAPGWIWSRATPILDKNNEIVEWFGTATDVTLRKAAQEAQRRSAETFATLIEQSPLGIYVVDSQFRISLASLGSKPAFQNVQPVIGRDFGEVMHAIWPAPFAEEAIALFRHTLATGEPYLAPGLTEIRKDIGAQESYEWQINRVVLADGQFGVVCYYFDSTRLQRAKLALQESEERCRMLADNMSQLAWTCEKLGDMTWFNQRWLDYTGLSLADMGGWGWRNLVHRDHVNNVVESMEQSRLSGEIWEDTFALLGKDGKYRWFLSRALPIRNEEGTILLWFGTNTDISELREAQQLLHQADERKNVFLATLAHELRNPLAPIRMGIELLKINKSKPLVLEETLSTMERQTLQLITLVDDLLDISRITRGKLELRKSCVELKNVITSAVEASHPFIKSAGHKLTVTLPENSIYLQADPHRLTQVISNLLNNAAKFTLEGGEIFLSMRVEGESLVFTVKDNGIGISPDMQESIFEMFTQIEHPIEKTFNGLGLGLTLVKQLVELHGGTISVYSEGEFKGSEFVVRLPALPQLINESNIDVVNGEKVTNPTALKILIVDDNKDASNILAQLMAMLGNEVRVAYDGVQAIQLAGEYRPDVILMDIGMPNMNGYEATRAIRQQPWGTEMTIIALTGWGQIEDRQKSAQAGFDHHLVKPLDFNELTKLLSVSFPVVPQLIHENSKDVVNEEKAIKPKALKVLVVDDSKDAAGMLVQLMEMLGNETNVAHDGVQAIQLAGEHRPDVILMDVSMPNMNGYEAARKIREQPWGAEMTIIALTGWAQTEDRQKSADAGFDHHLVKPVDFNELTELLSEIAI